jgi:hypothetical protein
MEFKLPGDGRNVKESGRPGAVARSAEAIAGNEPLHGPLIAEARTSKAGCIKQRSDHPASSMILAKFIVI